VQCSTVFPCTSNQRLLTSAVRHQLNSARIHTDTYTNTPYVYIHHAKQVDFFATYTADVLTSSVKTILDIAWTIGFFVSGDFLLHRKAWLGRDLHDSTWEQVCSIYSGYTAVSLPVLHLQCMLSTSYTWLQLAVPNTVYM
jgi:hypothetical protein